MAIFQRNGMVTRAGQYAPNTDRRAVARTRSGQTVTPSGTVTPNASDLGTALTGLRGGRRAPEAGLLSSVLQGNVPTLTGGTAIPRTASGPNSALLSAINWAASQIEPEPQNQPVSSPANYPEIALPGWDQAKWSNPAHTTVKYQAGRILAKYPATTEGLQQAWPEIKTAFPNARFDGVDSIDFGDGNGYVDVLAGASAGGRGWQWVPASSRSSAADLLSPTAQNYSLLNSGDSYADRIMAYLLARLGGR